MCSVTDHNGNKYFHFLASSDSPVNILTYQQLHESHSQFSTSGATRLIRLLHDTSAPSQAPHIIQLQLCPFLYIVQPLSFWPSSVYFPLNFTLQDGVCQGSLRSHHTSKPSDLPLLNNLQQYIILPNAPCNSSGYIH